MQNTDAGRYFDRIFEIDSLLSLGFYVNPRTVSRSDLEALKTLHNERRSREAELAKPR